jgi:hypothetical protein
MVTFTEKFTGAKAHLFAKVCEQYMDDAQQGCNDAPEAMPLFSWLSPYQRLELTKEVMLGLLCPDEPFPPGTVQHLSTYYALLEYLKIQIGVELDLQRDMEDVGEDLRLPEQDERIWRTEEEQRNFELIRDRAEKNKKKLDKKFVEEDKDAEATEYRFERSEFRWEESFSRMNEIIATLFNGTPLSTSQREQIRRPTTSDEEQAFRWRLLCEAAFQEDDEGHFSFPPLALVNFDFRSNSLDKWNTAIDALYITFSVVKLDKKEKSLVSGAIDERAYADKSQHGRIQAIKKQVSILRKMYENTWDANLLAQDQRCIYAVCSNATYYGYGHKEFVEDFEKALSRQQPGVNLADRGNYQVRYNVYKAMAPSYHQEGLKHPFHAYSEECTSFEEGETPVNYTCEFESITASCRRCLSSENLKSCSKCRVVCYCSRECQVADWPKHKEYCKEMARLRKDKEAVAAMAKNMR